MKRSGCDSACSSQRCWMAVSADSGEPNAPWLTNVKDDDRWNCLCSDGSSPNGCNDVGTGLDNRVAAVKEDGGRLDGGGEAGRGGGAVSCCRMIERASMSMGMWGEV